MVASVWIYLSINLALFGWTYGQQSIIKFVNPQAQTLWDDRKILGNSTFFAHPVTLGTTTECDKIKISEVFTEEFQFQVNYTISAVNRNNYQNPAVRVVTRAGYRNAKASRVIDRGVLSAEGCVMACITEKDFICRDCDYFKQDGGKCALHNTTGQVFLEAEDIHGPLYVGSMASDHYILYKHFENPETCPIGTEDKYAHSYFALGWKAMEAGWYSLAHRFMDEAIGLDPGYYMAYVGKMLSHENMGYNISDDVFGSYKDKLQQISEAVDFHVKLSKQEQLLVEALNSLQSGDSFNNGVSRMISTLQNNTNTVKHDIIKVIKGNGDLLKFGTYQILHQLANDRGNIFALQLLTHNLNPYKNGKSRISESSQAAAVAAIFEYKKMEVVGAWQITLDCVDIAEYYAKWSTGSVLLNSQIDFLYRNMDSSNSLALLTEDKENLIVHQLGVVYMSKALQRINQYERLHFFLLQMAQFYSAEQHLLYLTPSASDDEEQKRMLRYRMKANAYFSTYDYIYDKYARENIQFHEDWKDPIASSSSDLALASRTYYWAAAAVQQLTKGIGSPEDIISAFHSAKTRMTNINYKALVDIYETVVSGTKKMVELNYRAAMDLALQAAAFQDKLEGADFTIPGNADSEEFKMLIPLGYQFHADTLRSLLRSEGALEALDGSLTLDDIINAYEQAVSTPPLNASRILRGYGESLQQRDKNKPKKADEPPPTYISVFKELENAWKDSDVKGEFKAKEESTAAVNEYHGKTVEFDCPTTFQLRAAGSGKLCWGGYIIIGVAVAFVVIIAIVISIICLRRKSKAPLKNKEKDGEFLFTGPDLSRQDSFGNSTIIEMKRKRHRSTASSTSIKRPFLPKERTEEHDGTEYVDVFYGKESTVCI